MSDKAKCPGVTVLSPVVVRVSSGHKKPTAVVYLMNPDYLTVLPPSQDDGSVHERVLRPPPPVLKKKSLRIKALDAEVRLPAGHAGASWVTFDAKTLTATNRCGARL